MVEVPRPDLAWALGAGEALLPAGCRLVPALSGSGLFRSVRGLDGYYVAPAWVCYAGRSLHDLPLGPRDYEDVLRVLRDRGDLRAALVAVWLLSLPGDGRPASRTLLAAVPELSSSALRLEVEDRRWRP